MPFKFSDLDQTTRTYMLQEISSDLSGGILYTSTRLNDAGVKAWPGLIQQAVQNTNPESLAEQLRSGLLNATEERRKPTGGFTTVSVPVTAPETLAEGEFNRFYIRGLCARAIDEGKKVRVYRAKEVVNARSESQTKLGNIVDPTALLADLRKNIGLDTFLGLPPGPNSGLCVELA